MAGARRGVLFAVVALGALAGLWYRRHVPQDLEDARLGAVKFYPGWLAGKGLAFLLSDDRGWTQADDHLARRLARAGYDVAGLDSSRLLSIANGEDSCLYLPGRLEGFSQSRQQASHRRDYRAPVLLGHGSGATLAFLAQRQAPPLAFETVLAQNPAPQVLLAHGACGLPDGKDLPAGPILPGAPGTRSRLRLWTDAESSTGSVDYVARSLGTVARDTAGLPTGPAGLVAALQADEAARSTGPLADLPLVEILPATPKGKSLVVLYSGDGGWRDLDQSLASVLSARGLPVVGLDALRYYWHEKKPDVGARDLARLLEHYLQAWHREDIILIGFSFGANVLPSLYGRLPPTLQAKVRLLSLLSPERSVGFAVTPGGWFGLQGGGERLPIGPELARLPAAKVQCIYGEDEAQDSLCTVPEAAAIQRLKKAGGHHFDQDYERLANDILSALPGYSAALRLRGTHHP